MTSEERPASDLAAAGEEPASPAGQAQGDGAEPRRGRGRLELNDPKAIRALAHPVRWALLDAIGQAGTLTATQASEMLGESPANCAFHLRTLAKYGFVEEAGGGRGRERPWRQTHDGMTWRSRPDDPQLTEATRALDQIWLDRSLARAQHSLTSMSSWPKELDDTLGGCTSRIYLTPDEAAEIYTELQKTFERLVGLGQPLSERRDPEIRPSDAMPIEFVLLGYPVLGLPPLPGPDDDSEPDDGDGTVDGEARTG